jgi:hypothetical protein
VQIEYTLRNAVRYFETHDEFYWNVTGNDWPVPIDHAEAFVALPPASAGSLRAQAYTGVYGSTEGEATSTVTGADVTFETTNPLPMRGGLTIDIYIPKGILKEPSSFTRLMWFLGSNPIVFLPLVTFAVMFTLWWYKRSRSGSRYVRRPMYEPPADMTPLKLERWSMTPFIRGTSHPRSLTWRCVAISRLRNQRARSHFQDQGLHLSFTAGAMDANRCVLNA